nr:retrovirus-related Pol polyprotein from transposon TNT 1-94 [Tanacetum cinerariifolium]
MTTHVLPVTKESNTRPPVKTIRCDNGTEFKNRDIIKFCGSKWIKREYSNARTSQQNGVAERKNMTLIEAARTMLADSFLPNTFWAEAVSAAYYVLNRVLVTKSQNKKPYELLIGKIPIISYIRPFGCHVTILNTIDYIDKFEKKFDEGFLVGYSLSSKAFRVYNLETKRVKENLHINYLENKPNVVRKGPTWLFDIDYLTDSINYQPITVENKANKTAGPKETNNSAGTQDCFDAGNTKMEADHAQKYYVLPLWSSYTSTVKSSKAKNGNEKFNKDTNSKTNEDLGHRQEEGIDYDEVFAPVPSIEATMIFLAFASYIGFIVYQMDVKSAFLYGKINEEDKYAADILKKFDLLSVKTTSTLIETKKPLVKDKEAANVDVHLYRSMISSLMYLTASRPDIMYAVCACFRFQVTPKTSHLQALKRIFRYLKDQPKLGFGILESQPLTWKPTQTVTMLEQILIGNPQQEVVNFLVLKIHTDDNVADRLTKAFDVSSYNCQWKVNAHTLKLTTTRVYAAEEAVNTAGYILNRILVTKPQNKTPYELLTGRQPIISYLRPFRCHMTILNTIDQMDKFDGKSDSGFLVGYSLNIKDFRVYNLETKRVEENLHVNFLENKPNVAEKGHAWMFDLDYLTNSMNYEPVSLENQAYKSVGSKEANNSAGTQANDDQGTHSEEIDLHDENFVLPIWSAYSTTVKSLEDKIQKTTDCKKSKKPDANTNITNLLNAVSAPVSVVGPSRALNDDEPSYPNDSLMPYLEDIYASSSKGIFTNSSYDDEDLPFGKKAIGTKWVYRNKKDEKGVVDRNKATLVAQGHRPEEEIDYDEVFTHVARIEAIRIFLAFASHMGFIFYQMDVKSVFLYGTIDEKVYVT